MSQHDAQMLAIAGTCLVAVIVAMYLMRFIRIDGAFGRSAYRVVFSVLAGLLAPTLIVGGHGALLAPFIACLPLLAHNTTSIAALELGGYGLLGIGTDVGRMWVLTLPSLLLFALMVALPWSRAKRRRSRAKG
jgi:hypothetical protein